MISPRMPSPPPPMASGPAPRPRASVTWPVSSVAPRRKRICAPYPSRVLLFVPMHGFGTECGHADRDVFSPPGRRVADALARGDKHGLACSHRELAAVVLDDDRALEDDRHLVELRCLGGLLPPRWARHPRDAELARARVDATDELADDLVADAGDHGGGGDVERHRAASYRAAKRDSARARRRSASTSRSRGAAAVTSASRRCSVTCATSCTARSKAASFAREGFCIPLTLRTYCT